MTQSVGDLIVNLDLNSPKFTEQLTFAGKKLTDMGQAANEAATQTQQAFSRQEIAAKRAGISVGQYSAAMRTLPAQFTDIATQLAGGQSPWLILLQQGGQIKDSFGGLRPMFSALMGTISPVGLGVGALAAATAALAFSFYQGSATLSDFNKILILSGNSAGLTAQRMLAISVAGERAGLTVGQTSEALTALVNSGVNAGANFDALSVAVARFTELSGLPVDKVADAFGKLVSDPTAGLIAMAQQFHNVTAEQIAFVAQLQRSGDAAGALTAANDLAAEGFNRQTHEIEQSMGTLQRWAHETGNAFSSMWDKLLDIGRPDTGAQMLKQAQQNYDIARKNYEDNVNRAGNSDAVKNQYKTILDRAAAALSMAQQQADIQASAQQGAQEEGRRNSEQIKYAQQAQANFSKTQTALQKYTARQEELNKALKEGRILQADYSINMAAAKKEYEDSLKKPPKARTPGGVKAYDTASAQTLELETQLQVLQQHQNINDTISTQRQLLWKQQARFSVLEAASKTRTLTDEEKSLLASKDKVLAQAEINARLGDQIVSQERINQLQDNSQKYITQISEKTRALSQSAGLSSVAAQRQMEEAQLRQGWTNKGGSLDSQGFNRELAALREFYSEQDRLRGDWQSGALTSLANFADEATNYNRIAADTTSSVMKGATSSISDAFTGIITRTKDAGEAVSDAFSGMGQMVIQTLANMAAQWLAYQAVQLVVGKTTQASASAAMTSNATASSFMAQLNAYASTAAIPIVGPALAPAAMAAAAAVTAPLVAAVSAASLVGMAHSGIDNVPQTGTWLLQKGERVVTANTSAKLDATLSNIQKSNQSQPNMGDVNVNYHLTGKPDESMLQLMDSHGRQLAKRIKSELTADIVKPQNEFGRTLNGFYRRGKLT